MRAALLASTLPAVLLLAAACLEEEAVETQDIVATIPWPDEERFEYVLLDRDGEEERGRGTLSVTRQDEHYELQISFANKDETDDSLVLVDAATLKPVFVRREIRSNEELEIVEAEYDAAEEIIEIVEIIDDERRTVPNRLEKEHYYDNDSSLFLWRTIPFREGYEASYHTVLVNQGGRQLLVTLKVVDKEEVTVPAGAFQTWRVEISAGGVAQVAWFADTPERPLVQYDNSLQLLQLTSLGDS